MAPASQQKASSADSTANSPPSVFGTGEPKVTRSTTAGQKRKATDLSLNVITIDSQHDLTVIVGSVEHKSGQKAFRINRGSFRNVSTVWAAMLSGKWKESIMSEITFPDDNCDSFLIVLRIAHFQLSELPKTMSREALVELAVLSDKYELHDAIRMGAEAKRWMEPYHRQGDTWPAISDINDLALLTPAFGKEEDFKYFANHLAMNVQVNGAGEFYMIDTKKKSITIRSDSPASTTLQEVRRLRSEVLSAWVATCAVGFGEATKAPLPPCRRPLCAAGKIGILLLSLKTAGFYPSPHSTDVLHKSIVSYWKDIKIIGNKFSPYRPCNQNVTNTHNYNRYDAHTSACTFEACFGDFGIIKDAQATLQRHAHPDIWKDWQANNIVPR